MLVRRERRLGAEPADVWRLVSDPARLPLWWPGSRGSRTPRRRRGRTCSASPQGQVVRADYSLRVRRRSSGALRWRQELEESPFERILAESNTEIRAGP